MTRHIFKEQTALLNPIVDHLIDMTAAARTAFNRHSRASLADLAHLKQTAIQEISLAARQVDELASKGAGEERAAYYKLLSILTHLNMIAETFAGLSSPLEKKIKDAVLFSDKAVTQTNRLFDSAAGLLRTLLDILLTDNDFLKKYAVDESRKLSHNCMVFASEHEDRLIEGVCAPQAAPIFLAILDRMQILGQHQMEIARLLSHPV